MQLTALPASLSTACAKPVVLPNAALAQADVERLWARDRAALVKCGLSHAALVAHYQDLSGRLSAANTKKGR